MEWDTHKLMVLSKSAATSNGGSSSSNRRSVVALEVPTSSKRARSSVDDGADAATSSGALHQKQDVASEQAPKRARSDNDGGKGEGARTTDSQSKAEDAVGSDCAATSLDDGPVPAPTVGASMDEDEEGKPLHEGKY